MIGYGTMEKLLFVVQMIPYIQGYDLDTGVKVTNTP